MDIGPIVNSLAAAMKQVDAAMASLASNPTALNNPETLLQVQRQLVNYNSLINFSSTFQKVMQGLVSGILQRIT
jgi:type III secretion apparatus needle protein